MPQKRVGMVDILQMNKAKWTLNQQEMTSLVPKGTLKKMLAIDSGATIGTANHPSLIDNVVEIPGVSVATGNGPIIENKVGDLRNGLGKAFYNPDASINLASVGAVSRQHRVTYDSAIEDAFMVHTDRGVLRFDRTPNDLFMIDPARLEYHPVPDRFRTSAYQPRNHMALTTYEAVEQFCNLVTSANKHSIDKLEHVKTNLKFYTPRQIQGAKRARRLLHSMGFPTIRKLKEFIRLNMAKDNPVTLKDCDIAEDIFGPDEASIMGRSKRRRPRPVQEYRIRMPDDFMARQGNISLRMDLLFINKKPFLATDSARIHFRTCYPLANREPATIREALDLTLNVYNDGGFTIKDIDADQEFKAVLEPAKDGMEVEVNYAPANTHVPGAERNNQFLKERIRAMFHSLPYRCIPRTMLDYMAMHATHLTNLIPPDDSPYPTYSPWTIVTGRQLDYERHCQFAFGEYVMAHEEEQPRNSMVGRGRRTVYLRPSPNDPGGHDVFDLDTAKVISRRHLTKVPITDDVIRRIEALAKRDKIDRLQIRFKRDPSWRDSSWLAGVDDEDEDPEDDPQDDFIHVDPVLDDDETASTAPSTDNSSDSDSEDDDDDGSNPGVIADEPEQLPPPSIDDVQEAQDEMIEFEAEQPQGLFEEYDLHPETPVAPRRSTRASQPPEKLIFDGSSGQTYESRFQSLDDGLYVMQYDRDDGIVMAYMIEDMFMSMIKNYSLKAATKEFGDRATQAAFKEILQLHDRGCFAPVYAHQLSGREKGKSTESFMFLVEKKSGEVKARTVSNGSTQRKWMGKEDSSSPTVSTDALFLTAMVDAMEDRYVVTLDIPNAFIQTVQDDKDRDGDRFIMKI